MQVERGGARRSRFSVEQPGSEDGSAEREMGRLEDSQGESSADEKAEPVKLGNIATRSDKLSTPVVEDQEQLNKETSPIMTDCTTEEKPPKVEQSKPKVFLSPKSFHH